KTPLTMRLSTLFSRWSVFLSSLSGRPNYPLPPEVGRFSGKKWSEISVYETSECGDRNLRKYSTNDPHNENEPKWLKLGDFIEGNNLIMKSMGQQQHIMDIGLLESAFHRPNRPFSISAFLLLNGYDLVADKISTENITLDVAM
ncbi:22809_t:CDS:2, partial [Racocetra persica]